MSISRRQSFNVIVSVLVGPSVYGRKILEGTFAYLRVRRALNVKLATSNAHLEKLLASGMQVDGIVYLGENDYPARLARRVGRKVKIVAHYGSGGYVKSLANLRSVVLDNGAVARCVMEYATRRGFGRIVYVCGANDGTKWREERAAAMRRAAKAAGIGFRVEALEFGRMGEGELVVAENDDLAYTLSTQFAETRAKGQLLLMGIDNDAMLCECALPPITSVELDSVRAGWLGMELLWDWLRQGEVPRAPVRFGAREVVERESTVCGDIAENPLVRKGLEFIRINYDTPIGVKEVAAAMGVPLRTAQGLFAENDAEHKSINGAIRAARVEHMKRMLAETDIKTSVIAATCGYASDSQARAAFKVATGLPLAAYRAAHGNGIH